MSRDNILDNFNFDEEEIPEELPFDETYENEVVAKYYSMMEADVAAARLRAEGIPCFLANTFSQTILAGMNAVVRLHVRPQDVEKARDLLVEETPGPEVYPEKNSVAKGLLIILSIFLGSIAIAFAAKLLLGL